MKRVLTCYSKKAIFTVHNSTQARNQKTLICLSVCLSVCVQTHFNNELINNKRGPDLVCKTYPSRIALSCFRYI